MLNWKKAQKHHFHSYVNVLTLHTGTSVYDYFSLLFLHRILSFLLLLLTWMQTHCCPQQKHSTVTVLTAGHQTHSSLSLGLVLAALPAGQVCWAGLGCVPPPACPCVHLSFWWKSRHIAWWYATRPDSRDAAVVV